MAGQFHVPVGLEFGGVPRVRWRNADGARFTEPFFDDTLRRLRRTGTAADPRWTALATWSGPPPALPPVVIVLHVSRCGSTLVSRMLASLPGNLVVSEAPIFDDILRARRGDRAIAPVRRDRWLRHAAAAFVASQAVRPGRLVLKLDCWHIFEIDRLRRAFPDAPLLFVHRAPLEVLVSLMRRPSLTLVRGTVTPDEIGIAVAQYEALPREEFGAAILGAFFREAARHRTHLVPVPYSALPDFVWTSFPGLTATDDEIAHLRRASRADAKTPDAEFSPDGAAKRAEASAAVRAACARWADPAYETWSSAV